jgi:hypothetical protein
VKRPAIPLVFLVCSMALAACSPTPSAVSTLMQQVTAASQAHDKSALRACFATEKVTSDQIDQHLGSWDEYLNKGNDDAQWTYSSITYVSLADAAHDKDILPDTISTAQGTTVGGMKFAPNITVLGFIKVLFKQPNGMMAGATEPVGMASDGTAKIALEEPQH